MSAGPPIPEDAMLGGRLTMAIIDACEHFGEVDPERFPAYVRADIVEKLAALNALPNEVLAVIAKAYEARR